MLLRVLVRVLALAGMLARASRLVLVRVLALAGMLASASRLVRVPAPVPTSTHQPRSILALVFVYANGIANAMQMPMPSLACMALAMPLA